MNYNLELVLDTKSILGEGAIWDYEKKLLYWVDIEKDLLHIYNPELKENRSIDVGERISTVVPKKSGGLLIALEKEIATIDLSTQQITKIIEAERGMDYNRFNEGKCSPNGSFWVGTISEKKGMASLYRLASDYSWYKMISGVTNSNGIIWSPNEKIMYYIDTPTQQIVSYDYDKESGGIYNSKVIIEIPKKMGYPDGMTIDEEGMLWVALYSGGAIARWNPESGKLIEKIELPTSNVTSCAFGGKDLDELYITTARQGLTNQEPYAGALFKVKTKVKGIPAYEFND